MEEVLVPATSVGHLIRRALEAEVKSEPLGGMITLHSLFSLLSYQLKTIFPRVGTARSGHGPSTSIIKQENAPPQICPDGADRDGGREKWAGKSWSKRKILVVSFRARDTLNHIPGLLKIL